MKYAIFVTTLFFVISNSVQMPLKSNPCKAWFDMLEQAKKNNALSPETVALINAQVKKEGCTTLKGKDKADYEKLYKIAGALVECVDEERVIPGVGPIVRRFCTYTIDFRNLNEQTDQK